MKVELDNVTLGYSSLSQSVFAGTSIKPGVWRHKVNVTQAFIHCAIQKWEGHKEVVQSGEDQWEISVKKINKTTKPEAKLISEVSDLKVFELRWVKGEEKEWVCARTNIEALKTYFSITSTGMNDLDDVDEIVEVPKEKWGDLTVNNSEYDKSDPDDWETKTFEEYMKDQTGPDIIAGTMYE